MKTRLLLAVMLGIIALAVVLFSGCYTQLSTREDQQDEYSQQPDSSYDSSYAGEYDNNNGCCGYDDGWYHSRIGFAYYYPSFLWPSFAYYDPFWYDPYWWGYGNPYWYYGYGYGYGYGFGYPYPYSFYGGYYSPYYHHYPGYYAYNTYRNFGSTRGFGSGRTPTAVRTDVPQTSTARGGYNLPVGTQYDRPVTGSSGRTSTPTGVSRPTRTTGRTDGTNVSRPGTTRTDPRGSAVDRTTRGGSSKSGVRSAPTARPRQTYTRPAPGQRSYNTGGQRRSAPTYSAPPSRSAPSGGGVRGGGSGGGGGRSGGGGGGGGRGGRGR